MGTRLYVHIHYSPVGVLSVRTSTGTERGRGGGVLINLDTPSAVFFKVVVRAVGIRVRVRDIICDRFTCQLLIFTVILSINRLLYLSSVAIVRNGDA